MEYAKVRARQDLNDRVALVCFSNETRFVVHPIAVQDTFTLQHYGDEVTLRGSAHIGKGLRGVRHVFKRQRKPNHQRHVILLTDYWDDDATHKARKLGLIKYEAVIHVVLIGQPKSSEDRASSLKVTAHQPGGMIRYRYVKDAKGLIKHFRQLAATGDNHAPPQGQFETC